MTKIGYNNIDLLKGVEYHVYGMDSYTHPGNNFDDHLGSGKRNLLLIQKRKSHMPYLR